MRLSTKARYALRAMVELAMREGNGPQQLREIARAQKLSPKYLDQLTILLRRAGLLISARGPSGGYTLARPAREITALEIVTAVEGPLELLDCVGNEAACARTPTCVTRDLWARAGQALRSTLASTTLADLRDEQRAANERVTVSYEI